MTLLDSEATAPPLQQLEILLSEAHLVMTIDKPRRVWISVLPKNREKSNALIVRESLNDAIEQALRFLRGVGREEERPMRQGGNDTEQILSEVESKRLLDAYNRLKEAAETALSKRAHIVGGGGPSDFTYSGIQENDDERAYFTFKPQSRHGQIVEIPLDALTNTAGWLQGIRLQKEADAQRREKDLERDMKIRRANELQEYKRLKAIYGNEEERGDE